MTRRSIVTLAVAFLPLMVDCHGQPESPLIRLEDSRELAARLRVQFSQATEASNRAVMADTDAASSAAAREAETATKSVESSAAALARALTDAGYTGETQLLREFEARFSEYKELDHRILGLAVENTNLKAQALSFGAGSRAADAFCDALKGISAVVAAKDQCRSDALVADAVVAVRELQVLQAPHIAERDDAAMTRIEQRMTELDGKARAAVQSLKALAAANVGVAVSAALSKLDDFKTVNEQIIVLSRRNTNLLSLDLSLGKKPPLVAACDARIRALQEALARAGSKARR